jgi:hypothetical protein
MGSVTVSPPAVLGNTVLGAFVLGGDGGPLDEDTTVYPTVTVVSIEAIVKNLKVVRGAVYDAEVNLWTDEAHTVPFNLEGWTVTLNPAGLPSLTVGDGLHVPDPALGAVQIALNASQTVKMPVGKYHHVLWVELGETRLAPVTGTLQVSNP